jgi:putative transposase
MCRRWRAGREGTPVLKVVHDEAEPNEASGSVLDEIVREAARQMLAVALQAEVSAYIDAHAGEVDENGHLLVVRNGHHNEREVITAAGPVPVRAPRVNDKRTDPATGERKRFASAILPAWARKSPRVAEVLPLLYLHGLSSSDFGPALTQFLGTSHGLSAATITRLTKDWQDEATTSNKRSLVGTDYVYCWVDGIHLKVRLEQDKVCLLVMIGVRADGTKELIALDEVHRESTESSLDLLRGCAGGTRSATCSTRCPSPPSRARRRRSPRSGTPRTRTTPQPRPTCSPPTTAPSGPRRPPRSPTTSTCCWPSTTTPPEHWIHLRTTNPIESTFATVRLRQRVTKGPGSRAAGVAMAFKLIESAQTRWRAVNAPHLVALVRAGAVFKNGRLIERPDESEGGDQQVA